MGTFMDLDDRARDLVRRMIVGMHSLQDEMMKTLEANRLRFFLAGQDYDHLLTQADRLGTIVFAPLYEQRVAMPPQVAFERRAMPDASLVAIYVAGVLTYPRAELAPGQIRMTYEKEI